MIEIFAHEGEYMIKVAWCHLGLTDEQIGNRLGGRNPELIRRVRIRQTYWEVEEELLKA